MATDDAGVALTVYSRSWCHLCDEMIAGLHTLQARFHFSLQIVDVDADDGLLLIIWPKSAKMQPFQVAGKGT
jgi:hypothetical protein